MKEIELTQGKVAIVDDDDYEYLRQFSWFYFGTGNNNYARRTVNYINKDGKRESKGILMHAIVNNTPKGMFTDHINGNGLDNRKENLRTCTSAENTRNRGKNKNNTTGYKGVVILKTLHKGKIYRYFVAQTMVANQKVYLGTYPSAEDAAKAYNEAALKYFGEFAQLNEVA